MLCCISEEGGTVRVGRLFGLGSQVSRQRRGLSAIYFVFLLIALAAFVSMAVDIGRVRLATNQIQLATDAAARAAADSLPISTQTTIDNAVDTADANDVVNDKKGQTPLRLE